MRCDQFTEAIQGIVRKEPEFAGMGESAMAHTLECDACAEVLSAEQSLQTRLKLLAASVEPACAMPATEALLLEAFRANSRTNRPLRWYSLAGLSNGGRLAAAIAAFAAAAALLVAMVAPLLINKARSGQADSGRGVFGNNSRSGNPQTNQPPRVADRPGSSVHVPVQIDTVSSSERRHARSGSIRPASNPASSIARLRRPGSTSPGFSADNGGETFTDFMPIGFGGSPIPMDGGQMLRVRLPRSAMLAYGLPVNPDRADEPITADVIVGNDGMARAIRFVQDSGRR